MKRFLYLRIIAITTTVLIAVYMMLILFNWSGSYYRIWYMFLLNEGILALLMSHGIFLLYIYKKYYPDKEIPKITNIYYRIAMAGSWVCLMFLLLAIIAMIFSFKQNIQDYALIIFLLVISLFLVQLLGGHRMVKTIRRNVRQQLENSFT